MSTKPVGYLLGAGAPPIPILPGLSVTLGREGHSSVPVDDTGVSRKHASLTCSRSGIAQVSDLCSRNGTYVNEQKLTVTQPVVLRGGDNIRVGGKLFSYFSAVNATQGPALSAPLKTGPELATMQAAPAQTQKRASEDPLKAPGASVLRTTQRVAPGSTLESALSGNLADLSLPQVMLSIHRAGLTGRLYVQTKKMQASIIFILGQFYCATTGTLQGMEAVYACTLQPEGRFTFDRMEERQVRDLPKNSSDPLLQVLYECCRRMHEQPGTQ